MDQAQNSYYRERAQREQQLASSAGSREVRLVHQELAARYTALVREAERVAGRPGLSMVANGGAVVA